MIGIFKEELFSGFMPLIDCFMFMDGCQYNVNKDIFFKVKIKVYLSQRFIQLQKRMIKGEKSFFFYHLERISFLR